MALDHYVTLGRSGLGVSPLSLGTMTFGTTRWGTGGDVSRDVFDAYVEAGGNFVDTADVYSGGRSEEMIGEFIADRAIRDDIVLATKSGFAGGNGPHAGGNGAKHIHQALDGSLRRLKTDYVDLYWTHVWDGLTSAEELLETMAGLIRAGKVRYWGMSNAPAWYVAKVAAIAVVRGLPGPIALQYFYSLVNREVEDEHVPLGLEAGLGLVPWSPLAFGLLTGKYDREKVEAGEPRAAGLPGGAAKPEESRSADDKRLDGANPFGDSLFTGRNWAIVDELKRVADELGRPPAQVALAWVLSRPGVTSPLLGVSKVEQLSDNLAALDLKLDGEHLKALDAVSLGEPRSLYGFGRPPMRDHVVYGGASVRNANEAR